MPVREYVVHFMEHDNSGACLKHVNDRYIMELISEFGGVTVSKCDGYWKDDNVGIYNEPILRVIVSFWAEEDGASYNKSSFRALAWRYKEEAKQKAVYVVLDGEVDILE